MPPRDPVQAKKYNQEYYKKYKTFLWEKSRAYAAAHPEKIRAYCRKSAAKRRKAHPEAVKQCEKMARGKHHIRLNTFLLGVKNRPCFDCKHSFPYCVMEFDHSRGVKLFCPSSSAARSIAAIQKEVDKCDIVCANCHRIRTCIRRQQGDKKCPVHQ